jgi:phosphoribosyl 1,2-cyclic phosphate phosphodiesterase
MTPSRAIILGSGTSTGVPVLAKSYPPEFLANPKNHRTRPSLLLEGPTGKVLVDAGPDCRCQLLRQGVMDIEALLITHTHADHILGMDDMRAFCRPDRSRLPVYTSPEHQEVIHRVFEYAFRELPPGIFVPRFDLREPGEVLHLAGLELKIFWVEHGPTMVMGFRIGGFAYITDVSHIPDSARPFLEGLDVLILDAVRRTPHPNHFHTEKAIEVAQELGPKLTYFTHLSDDYDHDASEALLPPGIKLAYDGLVILLGDSPQNGALGPN